jgi:transcriptional regulator with XRE-family HTH domain
MVPPFVKPVSRVSHILSAVFGFGNKYFALGVGRLGNVALLPRFSCGSMGVMKQERRGSSSITIADIARLANTSKATVSRVLNGNMKVRPEMRERIVSVIEEYGFTPNRYARVLPGSDSYDRCRSERTGEFLLYRGGRRIDSVLSQHEYSMLMSFSNWDAEKELRIVNMLIKNHVDGVILSATAPNSPAIAVLRLRAFRSS